MVYPAERVADDNKRKEFLHVVLVKHTTVYRNIKRYPFPLVVVKNYRVSKLAFLTRGKTAINAKSISIATKVSWRKIFSG